MPSLHISTQALLDAHSESQQSIFASQSLSFESAQDSLQAALPEQFGSQQSILESQSSSVELLQIISGGTMHGPQTPAEQVWLPEHAPNVQVFVSKFTQPVVPPLPPPFVILWKAPSPIGPPIPLMFAIM